MNRWILCSLLATLCTSAAYAQAPPNDTCAGAIVFSCGQSVNLMTNTSLANNDYDQASVCTNFNSLGPDIVYRMDVPNGGTVNFIFDTDPTTGAGSGYDGSLYLITNCANPAGSCLDGDDGDPSAGDFNEQISWSNSTGLTVTTFLIVDGFMGISAPDRGTGTLTGTFTCPPPTGACCATDGTCSVTTQAACTGTWQGPGTDCDPNPCVTPMGACCRQGLPCAITTQADCAATGGQYFGDGSNCGPPTPCPVPVEPSTWGRIKSVYGN